MSVYEGMIFTLKIFAQAIVIYTVVRYAVRREMIKQAKTIVVKTEYMKANNSTINIATHALNWGEKPPTKKEQLNGNIQENQ